MTSSTPERALGALSTLLMILLALLPARIARADEYLGTYTVTAVAPGGAWNFAHPEVTNSLDWYVRDVKLNGVLLTEDVDYTVVDDGSNKGVVNFLIPVARGDRIEIGGTTLEPGSHTGSISFY